MTADIRRGAPAFGQRVGAARGFETALPVPAGAGRGFVRGFVPRAPGTEIICKCAHAPDTGGAATGTVRGPRDPAAALNETTSPFLREGRNEGQNEGRS